MYFAWISLPTAVSCMGFAALGAYVFLKSRREWVNICFGIGMGLLAATEFGNLMAFIQPDTYAVLFWKQIALMAEALLPVTWLTFSLSFTRTDPTKIFHQWKVRLLSLLALSMFFVVVVPLDTIHGSDLPTFLPLDALGQITYIFIFLGYIAVVANLEHTFRHLGHEDRQRFKYLILGLGGIFAFSIFLTTRVLLYSGIDTMMIPVASSALLFCSGLMAFSIVRHGLMGASVYVSRFVFYRSTTVLVVGTYLLLIGLGSHLLQSFNILPGYPVESLFVFAAILVLLYWRSLFCRAAFVGK